MGPPWAKRENGFVFREQVPDGITLYYEPHCDYDESSLAGVDSADIVITPCVNQELLNYPLVRLIYCPIRLCLLHISAQHAVVKRPPYS